MINKLRSRRGMVGAFFLTALVGSLLIGVYGGGVASASGPRLSWYACGKWGGKGVYEDSKCTKTGTPNGYSWVRLPNSDRAFVSSSLSEYRIGYNFSGVAFEIQCSGAQGEGTLKSHETGAQIDNYTLTLNECWSTKPMGTGCLLAGNQIVLKLSGKSPEWPETLNPELKMSAWGSFYMEGCSLWSLNGEYSVSGGFPLQVHNGESSVSTTYGESLGQLKVKGSSGWIDGASSIAGVFTSTQLPLKLDTAP